MNNLVCSKCVSLKSVWTKKGICQVCKVEKEQVDLGKPSERDMDEK